MCSNNFGDIVCGGYLFGALNAPIAPCFAMGPALTFGQLLAATPAILLWSGSNIFLFCLHNQKQPQTIAEDAQNKPWRPIPAGRLTPAQATRLLWGMHPLCFAVALGVGGLVPSAVLTAFHVWYNEFDGAANGVLKNLLNGVGIACFFAGPFEVATGASIFAGHGTAAVWLLILAATFATTSHTQDFRDTDGDRAAGRATIPLTIGDLPARLVLVVGILGWTEVACRFWAVGWAARFGAFGAGTVLIANLFMDRSHAGDVRAWKLWSVWVLVLVMLPLLEQWKTVAD